MDGLITILILIGVFAINSSKKKKKAQQKAAQDAKAFQTAAETIKAGKKPFASGEWQQFLSELDAHPGASEPAKPAKKPAAPAKKPAGPAVKPAAPTMKPAPAPAAKPAASRMDARTLQPLRMDHTAPEGTISTQGETAAEHAAHVSRILEEEKKLEQAQQTLKELRSINARKLRSAVVMSEVLGKPVSLRPRGYR